MTTGQIITKLDAAQVNGAYDAQTRRMMRDEAGAVRAAFQRKSGEAEATVEAVRVARMWGVAI